jgi:Uma2 family endonuclease
MVAMTVLPRDHEWTVADLEALPEDGLRYELVDGTLLVSPAPTRLHQRCLSNLLWVLRQACPPEFEVLPAPTDFQPTMRRSLQPDVLVCRRDDPGVKALTEPLLLAVEIVSPSSRSVDLVLKRELYGQAGVASYWVVDPDVPSITVWDLDSGGFGEAIVVSGDAVLTVKLPFPMTVVPSALLA